MEFVDYRAECGILNGKEGEMKAGHYEGGGYTWELGDVPMCSMCFENVATLATAHRGIVFCDDPNCHTAYVMQECQSIEFFDDDEKEKVEAFPVEPHWLDTLHIDGQLALLGIG